MKAIALLWSVYTLIVSGILAGLGWLAGFILLPFAAGFYKGQEHHRKVMTHLGQLLK